MIGALSLVIRRDWRGHRLRVLLTIAGIALGVAVFFAIRTANATLVRSLSSTVEKIAGRSTLQIVAGEAGFSEDILSTVRATPGVAAAEPVTETMAYVSGGSQKILVLGLDTASDLSLYGDPADKRTLMIKNPLAFANRSDSVAITRAFAERYSLKEGDRLRVHAPSGEVELTVRGLFSQSGLGEVYDGNVAVMDIYSAQKMFGRGRRIDRIDIANADGTDVDRLRAELASKLPVGVEVVRPELRGRALENSISSLHVGFTITSLMAMSIGIFIIFNSFSISVNQRWKDIAILRSLGVERGNIRRMFLVESSILGLVGSAAGIGLGFVMAEAAMNAIVTVTATIYGINAAAASVDMDPRFAAESMILGISTSLLAAFLPARAASMLEPALALRNLETRQQDGHSGGLRNVAGISLIAAGLLLTQFMPPVVGSYIQVSFAFMMIAGVILLLPLLLQFGARVLRPVMKRFFGPEGVIAVDTMAVSPRRTTATVGAIVVGLSFVFGNASLIQSQKAALFRSLDKALSADMLVTSSEQLHSRTNHFSDEVATRVTSLPEIKTSDALRVTATEIDGAEVTILAHQMASYFDISPDLLDSGDPALARDLTSRGEGILVSNNLAFRWHVKIGDRLRIISPRGELQLPVVGMLDYYRSENGTIFMDRGLYKRYWDDTDVDYIFIDLKDGVDRTAFKEKVQAAIAGSQRAFIYTHQEYKEWASKLIDQLFLMMYMQMIVAILVAAIGLVNTMLISVAERRREIGIFRAIGGLRGQVVKMVLLEAVLISIMGLAGGAVSGAMNGYFLVNTAAKVVTGFNLQLVVPSTVILASIPAIIIVAIISAWVPARNAARMEVVEAIGYE